MARRSRLAARRKAREWTQDSLAHHLHVARNTVYRWESGESEPEPWNRGPLADALGVDLDELDDLLMPDEATAPGEWTTVAPPALDDLEALELIRRVEASDTGPATLEALTLATDQLARAYTSTPPAELLESLRAYRGFVLHLLDGRVSLAHRRELVVIAGWLSLLIAICNVDIKQPRVAALNLTAARSMAHEADHSLLVAWAFETEAWQALTDGRPDRAAALCRPALDHVADGTSAHVQISMQEARASARLGLVKETHKLLEMSAASLDRMPPPQHPEHHFTFDRRKHISYSATTLAWLGDDDGQAVEYARQAVDQYDTGTSDGRWGSRLASARLDLALILARLGEAAEAAHLGTAAITSGRLRDSSLWRAAELDGHLTSHDTEVSAFHERLHAILRPSSTRAIENTRQPPPDR